MKLRKLGKVLVLTLIVNLAGAVCVRGAPVYFLVTERAGVQAHGDSYVLPLSAEADIAHARALIAQGPDIGEAIAVANIAKGADGINRDWLKPGAPAWNWHVTGFEGFADITAEVLDGWPGYVEENTDDFIASSQGRVGFWNYTVTRELGTSPVVVPLPAALPVGAGMLAALGGACAWRRARRRAHRQGHRRLSRL